MQSYKPLAIVLGIVAVAAIVAIFYRGDAPGTQTLSNNSSFATQATSSVRQGALPTSGAQQMQLEAECATQAVKTMNVLAQSLGSAYANFSQQNHYNPDFNVCFVGISYTNNLGTETRLTNTQLYQPSHYETIMNAYENSDLADCSYYMNRPGIDFSNPDSYTQCLIGNQKTSYSVYKTFVNARLGAGTIQ